jgi:cytochrome c oxidase subunit 2
VLLVLPITACASNGDVPVLSGEPERGRLAAVDNGCAVCHGQHGQGGAASGFYGLWGSEVELSDGRTVTADAEYIRRAIVDPAAEIVAGSRLEMPAVELTESEIAAMLAWIEALADR